MSSDTIAKNLVFAAGGILLHKNRIAVVHRPKYQDWSLPKGKVHPGENFLSAAIREVQEETCADPRVDYFAGALHYALNPGYKIVLFWVMKADRIRPFLPNKEIDEIRWAEPGQIREILQYSEEIELLDYGLDKTHPEGETLLNDKYSFVREQSLLDEAIIILSEELLLAQRKNLHTRENRLHRQLKFLQRVG